MKWDAQRASNGGMADGGGAVVVDSGGGRCGQGCARVGGYIASRLGDSLHTQRDAALQVAPIGGV